jgi:hypothetical protein
VLPAGWLLPAHAWISWRIQRRNTPVPGPTNCCPALTAPWPPPDDLLGVETATANLVGVAPLGEVSYEVGRALCADKRASDQELQRVRGPEATHDGNPDGRVSA